MKKFYSGIVAISLCFMVLASSFVTPVFANEGSLGAFKKQPSTSDISYSNILDCPSDEIIVDQNSKNSASCKELTKTYVDPLVISKETCISVADSKENIIASILSLDKFEINGNVCYQNNYYELNSFYDFSSTSRFHITDWACRSGIITESEKIEIFCDLIINRNFENIDCLESIIYLIQTYRDNFGLTEKLNAKITKALSKPEYESADNTAAERSITNEAIITSDNFSVHYDSSSTMQSEAQSVLSYFEETRTTYRNWGFEYPILESGETKYHIYLDPAPYPNNAASATCTMVDYLNSKTCPTYITIYNFSSFSQNIKERIAHEYFHAIQCAYNRHNSWFKEACANLGKIIVSGSAATCENSINAFIASSLPIDDSSTTYGAVLFPLTIYKKYGGFATIVAIYNEYSNRTVSISNDELREVITIGIQSSGANEGFNIAYRRMASYITDPGVWFASYPGASEWHDAPFTEKNINLTNFSNVSNTSTTISGSLASLTTTRYKLNLPEGFVGSVKIDMSYSDQKGVSQVYTISNISGHNIHYVSTLADKTSEFIQPNVGNTIESVMLIVSNISNGSDINFTANITLLPLETNMTFNSNYRHMERVQYLNAGECSEFNITFGTTGSKLIQTFGTQDTLMELYSSSGNLIASDDNDGYNSNSLIRYYVTAGTSYKIKIYFNNSSLSGKIKLSITPAYGALANNIDKLQTYEDIYAVSNTTNYSRETFAEPNYTRVTTFHTSENARYTFELESDIDTYIYVIDPTSTDLLKLDVDFNDDKLGSLDAVLTKQLKSGIPYLVIYSAYNPNALSNYEYFTLKIQRTN